MAWYDDKKKTTHVARYKDADAARREDREATAKGWVVRDTTTAPERVAVGRTISKAMLTAGIGLLARGRTRKAGTVTVTYERGTSTTKPDA